MFNFDLLQTFTTLSEVPEKIKSFYWEDEAGDLIILAKTEIDSVERLELFIAKGVQAHIEAAAERVAVGQKWQYFDKYHAYLNDLAAANAFNDNLPVVGQDERGMDIFAEPKPIPDEPATMQDYTGAKILAPFLRPLFKQQRTEQVAKLTVDIEGLIFDADEVSQDRMSRAILVMNDVETTLWILNDNEPVDVTKAQLKAALKAAGQAQTAIWTN
jgi:hypothetical protein